LHQELEVALKVVQVNGVIYIYQTRTHSCHGNENLGIFTQNLL